MLWQTFDNFHHRTSTRFTPYVVGVIIGFYIDRMETNKQNLDEFSKAGMFVLWTVPFVSMVFLAAINITNFIFYVPDDITIEVLPYLDAVAKIIASVSMGWFTIACHFGQGGIVNGVLSYELFKIASKFCFAVYLFHMVVQVALVHLKSNYSTFEPDELVCFTIFLFLHFFFLWILVFIYFTDTWNGSRTHDIFAACDILLYLCREADVWSFLTNISWSRQKC